MENESQKREGVSGNATEHGGPAPEPGGETPACAGGRIRNTGVLDLTWARSAEDLSDIKGIENVGLVLVPASLAGALTGISIENTGAVVTVPSGCKVQMHVGQVQMRGETLAAGSEDTILVGLGQLIVTTAVTAVGFREVQVVGQVLAPRGSESALGPRLSVIGQSLYYPEGARIVLSHETWSREFLEMLPRAVAYCVLGEVSVEEDVTVDLLKSKVTEIMLLGHIEAPRSLVPLLQVLTPGRLGAISARE